MREYIHIGRVPLVALLSLVIAIAAAVPTSSATTDKPSQIDLANGYIDGHRVLGRTVAGVTAGLGRPDYRKRGTRRYAIGYRPHPPFFVEVRFRREDGKLRAYSIVLQDITLEDARAGRLLRLGARRIQATIEREYGEMYSLSRAYRCRAGKLCTGEFRAAGSDRRVTFGRVHSGARFLNIWR